MFCLLSVFLHLEGHLIISPKLFCIDECIVYLSHSHQRLQILCEMLNVAETELSAE